MAPTFYHFSPAMELEEQCFEKKKMSALKILLCALLIALVILVITAICLGIKVNSPACQDGLHYKQECLNATGLLRQQLAQTQRELGEAQKRVEACRSRVVTLMESLNKTEKEHQQKMQEKEEEHQREIQKLKQDLLEATKKQESPRENEPQDNVTSAGSQIYLNRFLFTALCLFWGLTLLWPKAQQLITAWTGPVPARLSTGFVG